MPVALVGLPGSGKTAVGRRLAQRLQWPFVDTDQCIEDRIGCTIREFFEREGEARFRAIEAQVIAEQAQSTRGVLSTGGGAVLRAENRQQLREKFHVVYLCSSPEDLYRRLRHDVKRPLLQVEDPLGRLRELFAARDPLYREVAHESVETGRPSIQVAVNLILAHLELAGVATAPPAIAD
ncbi:shikimate kinase [Variovorax sp.]|uniref:shikimate kinase n=1 Tax=Variovorax sp. TaxID=1871043 RepID=UPI002D26A461|nr:shikimate kinase [Variovorax sp.]HYP82367.1 shikimate kinase [Variovorax sp.]